MIRRKLMQGKTLSHLCVAALIMLAVILYTSPANAHSNGESGVSGKSGSTCTGCHSTGTPPTITLTGPATVTSGSTKNTYTVNIAGGTGLDVAASAGTFTAGAGTTVQSGEITQSSPSATGSWTFTWAAPTVTTSTTVTVWAAGVNGFSGGTGTLQQAITVTPAVTAPSLSATPSSLSFAYQIGGTAPAAQNINVSSSGAALSVSATTATTPAGGTWLSATAPSGSITSGMVGVSVNPTGLAAGTYNGTVTIGSTGASTNPSPISVKLVVTAAAAPNLSATPSSLSFAYQIGGTAPAAQNINVSSSGAALSVSATTATTPAGGAWLSAAAPSGSITSGTVSVSVNPTGLAAGTYTGTVTIGSTGASTNPSPVKVTLVVSSANAPDFSLSASPSSLTIAQGASGTSTIKVTDLNGFTGAVGLGASGMPSGVMALFSGTTLTLTANGTAATGTSTVNITGTSGPTLTHSITLSLTVTGTSSGGALTANPPSLSFNYQMGGQVPASKTVRITSTGGFTATESDPWLSIAPKSGTGAPTNITASVSPAGLGQGSHVAQIKITAADGKTTLTVFVSLMISAASGGDGGGGTSGNMTAQPYVSDTQSGALAAAWVDNLGTSPHDGSDPRNRALVLSKGASAPTNGWAGAVIQNANNTSLIEVGFDYNGSIQCSKNTVYFNITTAGGTSHTLGGCTSSPTSTQSTAPTGWIRLVFDPGQASPPISSTDHVQSISIELGGSIAVIDNITINGALVGKGSSTSTSSTSTSRSRDD